MRIRVGANLSYNRLRDGDPLKAGYDVLDRLVNACDEVLAEAGYRLNRLQDGAYCDDSLSVEVS